MGDENHQFEDRLLDASLALYSWDAPRPGLESRVLAGVRAARRAERRRVWAWGYAFSAAALVLAVTILSHRGRRANLPGQAAAVAANNATTLIEPSFAGKAHGLPAPALRIRRLTQRPSRPRQFPTPAPLSEQEKLLMLYANVAPASALRAAEPDLNEPLEIPGLKIAALNIKPMPRLEDER